jgi:hypothetical protein
MEEAPLFFYFPASGATMNAVRAARVARLLMSVSACFVLASLAGCGGGGANKTHVTGKVIYKDAPVTGGTIKLYTPTGDPFSIYIKDDGTFSVDDAPAGEMKVAIETDSVFVPPPAPAGSAGNQGGASQRKKVAIPAKYNKPETSGLTWNPANEKTKTFDLKD